MELDYSILADGVSQRPDGKLDIFGASVDVIYASDVPVRHHQLALAVRLLLSRHEAEEAHRLKVVLLTADGAELVRLEGQLDPMPEEAQAQIAPGRRAAVSMVFHMAGIVFPQYGDYHLALHWEGTEIRDPMRLVLAPLPEAQ